MLDLTLLPDPDESVRCAEHARAIALDPGGTAIRADLLVSIDIPLPWPKPVFDHPLLVGVPDLVAASPVLTRVLASVPDEPDRLRMVAYGAGDPVTRREWEIEPSAVFDSLRAILSGVDPEARPVDGVGPSAEVWICTQGSHDTCCGTDGTRLAAEIDGRWEHVRVRRVSHTGGHRFAPTALTMPDGRMWANLDADALDVILGGGAGLADLAARCRGWWGAEAGAPQAAERAVLARHGNAWERLQRSVVRTEQRDDTTVVTLTGVPAVAGTASDAGAEPLSFEVHVVGGRSVPTIACRAPGGLPAKPANEWRVVEVRQLSDTE